MKQLELWPGQFLKCQRCGCLCGELRRQNTHYTDEASNYVILCDLCDIENERYWEDMWKEYHMSVM